MKKIFLLSIIILLTSFKDFQTDSALTFDYEVKYKMSNEEFSVFVSKSNSKDFLISKSGDYNKSLFTFLQDTKFFELRIYDANEVNWSGSEYQGDPSNEGFNELVETNETKIINNLKCNRYLGKAVIGKSKSVEVYISKNNKINNVPFLVGLRTKLNPAVKGLVMELNSIDNATSKVKQDLTVVEIKEAKKSIKISNEYLKGLIERKEYKKKHKTTETVGMEIVAEPDEKLEVKKIEKQSPTGQEKLKK